MTLDRSADDAPPGFPDPPRAAEFAASYGTGSAVGPSERVKIAAYAVGQIASYLRELLDTDPVVQDVWVAGELRSLSRSQAGHLYFTLRDPEGALACVFFRRENRGVAVEEGTQVLVHGRVSLWAERGELQLYVDALQPEGVGAQQAEFERLRRKLEGEGLFEPGRKRALPAYPRGVGVVTSAAGAVWHDIQTVLARRWPAAALLLAPCQVQGEGAAESVAWGVEALNEAAAAGRADLDVVIVARGGGSAEDLAAFNSEAVARAVYASALPVVSGVGHETDVTLVDFVADVRAATPSAAAELVAPDRAEEGERLRARRSGLRRGLAAIAEQAQVDLDAARERLTEALPSIDEERLRVDALTAQSSDLLRAGLAAAGLALASQEARLATLNPQATLARGYAIIEDASGRVRAGVDELAPDDVVRLRLHDGAAGARITAVERGVES